MFSGSPADHSGAVQIRMFIKRLILCAPLLRYQKFKREEGMIRSCINFVHSVALTTKRVGLGVGFLVHFVF